MLYSCVQTLLQFLTTHVLVFFILTSGLTGLYFTVYNKLFHPLRRFPGPFWGGVTDLYNTYLFATREGHLKLLALHQKYGQSPTLIPYIKIPLICTSGCCVRVAPNLISFSDPTLLPKVYHRHATKTPFYSTGMAGEIPPLLQTQDDAEHAAKLKILSPTASARWHDSVNADWTEP